MQIKKVEAIPICIPISNFRDAYNIFTKCPAVITRIETDTGIVGYGESSAIVPEIFGETAESITAIIRHSLASLLIGQDPFRIEFINSLMDKALGRAPSAKTGMDLALYDIVGKSVGQPVCNIIGGKILDKVPVSFEFGIKEPEEMARDAVQWVEKGLRTVKIKAGSGNLEKDLRRIKAVREAVGEEVKIRVDPNTGWSVHDCKRAAQVLREIGLEYLEQPIPSWDWDGLAEIREYTGLSIQADESVWTVNDVVSLAKYHAADLINLKIPKVGGLLKSKKMAAAAEGAGMTCIAGSEGEVASAIAAKLHLAASTRNAIQASDFTELYWLGDWILKEPIQMDKSGCVKVPSDPGLGVSVDENKIRKYAI